MMKVDSDGSPWLHGIQCGMARISMVPSTGSPNQPLRSTSFSARTDWSKAPPGCASAPSTTNNPPDEVDKGNFKVEIYFYPSKPAETIVIVVGQQQSGASAAEA